VKADSTDVTAVLRDQHRQIRRAFARGADEARRSAIWCGCWRPTKPPRKRTSTRPRRAGRTAAAAARVGEEKQAKELLARLYRIGPDGDGYLRGLRSLRRAALAHAAREERGEFPALDRLGPARRRLLGLEVRLPGSSPPSGRTRGSTARAWAG
jgi:hypothetical protein